ncbi:addiction module antidote protein [Cyanobium sp. NIES-981]|uniref:addiction module antidote protein n=1 Tax=Cyanobium sp. NIES-981 TaxID=1851505 RepID=UPI0007DCBFBE|nr:addiction module antidote protein [Cyanobium sp. NIES-981]SBO43855.1 protein of unknown function [Cyanobium sp. NIES-981]
MKATTIPYDVAEHLRTQEEMAAYLEACIEEADGDAAFIAKALGDIARAQGMTQVARDSGLSRESLYEFAEKISSRGEFSPSVTQPAGHGEAIIGMTQARCESLILGIGTSLDAESPRRLPSLENGLFMPSPPQA